MSGMRKGFVGRSRLMISFIFFYFLYFLLFPLFFFFLLFFRTPTLPRILDGGSLSSIDRFSTWYRVYVIYFKYPKNSVSRRFSTKVLLPFGNTYLSFGIVRCFQKGEKWRKEKVRGNCRIWTINLRDTYGSVRKKGKRSLLVHLTSLYFSMVKET